MRKIIMLFVAIVYKQEKQKIETGDKKAGGKEILRLINAETVSDRSVKNVLTNKNWR
jgi:hypothetical protein